MKAKDEKKSTSAVSKNRVARHDYHILETYEAGLLLKGSEVKSLRAGGINLKEGYAHVMRNELFLEGVHISPYDHSGTTGHPPVRSRKLLMHKREIDRIAQEIHLKGLTLVPLQIYFKKGYAKIELGLAKGKKVHDKRDDIKKREIQRKLDRINK